MQRPLKPRFELIINEDFTTHVEPSLPEFDDDTMLLSLDWDEIESYSTSARDQFAPMAFTTERFSR